MHIYSIPSSGSYRQQYPNGDDSPSDSIPTNDGAYYQQLMLSSHPYSHLVIPCKPIFSHHFLHSPISLFFLLIYLFPFIPPLDSLLLHLCMATHGFTNLCKLFHQKSIPSGLNLKTNHTCLKQHGKLISLFVKPTTFNSWRHSSSYSSLYPL